MMNPSKNRGYAGAVLMNRPMDKEKYIYNQHSLRYEKVKKNKYRKSLQIFGIIAFLAVIAAGIYLLTLDSLDDYKQQQKELAEMKKRYQEMQSHLELMQKTLENLHERDAAIYRQLLELDPTDEGFWNGGRGGTESSEELKAMKDEEIVGQMSERIAKMRQRLELIAKAQAEVMAAVKAKEAMLKAVPSIRPVRNAEKRLEYLSGFGYRKHPVFKILKMHGGIDFGADIGTPVYATGNGKIQRVEFKREGYGKHIVVDHSYGFQSVYAHLSEINVKVGQEIKRGQIIGRVGDSGGVAPHLHYEIHYKKKRVNPLHFCREGMTAAEYRAFTESVSKQNQALSIH